MDNPHPYWKLKRESVNQASGKAPVADGIPAEIYKNAGSTMLTNITELFQSMGKLGEIHRSSRMHP
jgi:hypothetical protein